MHKPSKPAIRASSAGVSTVYGRRRPHHTSFGTPAIFEAWGRRDVNGCAGAAKLDFVNTYSDLGCEMRIPHIVVCCLQTSFHGARAHQHLLSGYGLRFVTRLDTYAQIQRAGPANRHPFVVEDFDDCHLPPCGVEGRGQFIAARSDTQVLRLQSHKRQFAIKQLAMGKT